MNLDSLNKWLMLVANLGVIAGIFFVAVELRQNSQAAELQAAQSYVSLSHQLDFRLVDDPSMLAVLVKPSSELTLEESARKERWTFGMLRNWENGYYLNSQGVLDTELWAGQENFMVSLLARDNDLKDYYQQNRSFFSTSFIGYLDTLVARDTK